LSKWYAAPQKRPDGEIGDFLFPTRAFGADESSIGWRAAEGGGSVSYRRRLLHAS